MPKLRDARYCNLKLLLIYLVIYGHWIEPLIGKDPLLNTVYRCIYLVHMPLFAFLSGLFIRESSGCARQLGRTFSLYLFLQTAAVFLGNGAVAPFVPYWHLWYLLSCSFWSSLAWLWLRFCKRKYGYWILGFSVLLGCCCGYFSQIDRWLSLSRTLVFFPYFWLGVLLPADHNWKKLRLAGFCGLLVAIGIFLIWGDRISAIFLYQAAPYRSSNGFMLRLICYIMGFLAGLCLLSWMPQIRFPFTKAGANTLPAYILHAPVVLWLREQMLPLWSYPLICMGFLYFIWKIRQWHSTMFGITGSERRESRWPHSKKFTKNTQSRYTGSCSL